jgi:hypothetical protein
LTVTVRPVVINRVRVPAVIIVGVEILVVCNLERVAQEQLSKAFGTIHVTSAGCWPAYADGAAWIERLGGKEKFIVPLRKKLKDLQRKARMDRIAAIAGAALQAELARAVNMTIANQIQHQIFMRRMGFP